MASTGGVVARSVRAARARIFGEYTPDAPGRTGRRLLKRFMRARIISDPASSPYSLATFHTPERHLLWDMASTGNDEDLLAGLEMEYERDLALRHRVGKLPRQKGKGKRAGRK